MTNSKDLKDSDYYMSLNYQMVLTEAPDEDGYVVSFPDLPGCLTCGETVDEAKAMAEDAKKCWFSAMLEEHLPIKEPQN